MWEYPLTGASQGILYVEYTVWFIVYLRWNMDNIFIRTDPAGNIKADKAKSTEKIDGAIALIMALDRAICCGNDTGESVYEKRGAIVF